MYFTLIVAITILPNYLILCDDSATVIKFDVTIKNNSYNCVPQRPKYVLLENSTCYISVLHPGIIKYITCLPAFTTLFKERSKDGERQIYQITNWEPGVSLHCTILPVSNSTMPSTAATCEVATSRDASRDASRARLRSPPQEIFINSIKHAPTVLPVSESNYDAEITHYFEDGDTVKVECANSYMQRNVLRLHYSYFDTLHVTDLIFTSEITKTGPTSLRLGLTGDLNNTYALCQCFLKEETFLVKINFIMRPTSNIIDLQVNGLTMRTANDTTSDFTYKYYYKMGEDIKIRCIDRNNGQYFPVIHKSTAKTSEDSVINIPYSEKLKANDYSCQKGGVSKHVQLIEGPASIETCAVYMDIQSLRHDVPFIIHEDQDDIKLLGQNGDAYNIACSGYCNNIGPLYNVKFYRFTDADNTTELPEKFAIHSVDVKGQENFICMLMEEPFTNLIKRVELTTNAIEIPKASEISTTAVIATTEDLTSATDALYNPDGLHKDSDFPPWLMAVVAGIAGLFLCCVSVVIYKRRKGRKHIEVQTTVNYVPQVDSSPKSKPEPNPEITYAQPCDQLEEPGYTEPFRQALYATPIPKAQRPGNNNPGDYASVQRDVYSELKSLYAKVLPKSQRAVDKGAYGYAEIEPNLNQNDADTYGYAEVQPNVEFGKGSKYANVFKGPYVNSHGENNYAEPKTS